MDQERSGETPTPSRDSSSSPIQRARIARSEALHLVETAKQLKEEVDALKSKVAAVREQRKRRLERQDLPPGD